VPPAAVARVVVMLVTQAPQSFVSEIVLRANPETLVSYPGNS
jgi:hypothetical protein